MGCKEAEVVGQDHEHHLDQGVIDSTLITTTPATIFKHHMTASVPSVDISGWSSGSQHERREICAQIDSMGRSSGFLRLEGHGLPTDLCEQMLDAAASFFDLPVESKQRYSPVDKAVNRGYAGYGEESLAYSLGVEALPDMFEAFNIGTELPADLAQSDSYYLAERHRLFAPNVWPSAHLREVWLRYWAACVELAMQLDGICSLALGMPENFIWSMTSRAPNVMRANNYQRRNHHCDPQPGQMRMGAHTDYGVLTILLADPVAGLQILQPDNTWLDVVPAPGTLIVNIGDLLAQWTNDRWRSTLHRVVPPPADETGPFRRRSVAFFHEANYDALIEAMPTCVPTSQQPRYAPVTAGEHLMAKLIGPRTNTISIAQQTTPQQTTH
jgi:isopenicillin N synthase-like dioxygenase